MTVDNATKYPNVLGATGVPVRVDPRAIAAKGHREGHDGTKMRHEKKKKCEKHPKCHCPQHHHKKKKKKHSKCHRHHHKKHCHDRAHPPPRCPCAPVTLPINTPLPSGTLLPAGTVILPSTRLPTDVVLASPITVGAPFVPSGPVELGPGAVLAQDTVLANTIQIADPLEVAAAATLAEGSTLGSGTVLAPGTIAPGISTLVETTQVPSGTSASVPRGNITLPAGSVLGSDLPYDILFTLGATTASPPPVRVGAGSIMGPGTILFQPLTVGAGGLTLTSDLTANVAFSVPAGTELPRGFVFPGTQPLPNDVVLLQQLTLTNGFRLPEESSALITADLHVGTSLTFGGDYVASVLRMTTGDVITPPLFTVPAGTIFPIGVNIRDAGGVTYYPPGVPLAADVTSVTPFTTPANTTTTGVAGTVTYGPGTVVETGGLFPGGTELPGGTLFAGGNTLPVGFTIPANTRVNQPVPLSSTVTLLAPVDVPAGTVFPEGMTLPAGTVLPAGFDLGHALFNTATTLGIFTVFGAGTTFFPGSEFFHFPLPTATLVFAGDEQTVVLPGGTTVAAGLVLPEGASVLGRSVLVHGGQVPPAGTDLLPGSIIAVGSGLAAGTKLTGDATLGNSVTLPAGATLAPGSVLPAGTTLPMNSLITAPIVLGIPAVIAAPTTLIGTIILPYPPDCALCADAAVARGPHPLDGDGTHAEDRATAASDAPANPNQSRVA